MAVPPAVCLSVCRHSRVLALSSTENRKKFKFGGNVPCHTCSVNNLT